MEGEGLLKFPTKVRRILEENGTTEIKSMVIKRSPLSKLLTGAMSAFSLGKFGKRTYKQYDELFHLFCEVKLVDGKVFLIEKNERINIETKRRRSEKIEASPITNLSKGLTMNTLLENTRGKMGIMNFFQYSAVNNNCQDFIMALLQSNNLGDENTYKFVKQDTETLFKRLPYLQKFAVQVTDNYAYLGDETDKLREFFSGRGLPDNKIDL
jgi:hypothetical protein